MRPLIYCCSRGRDVLRLTTMGGGGAPPLWTPPPPGRRFHSGKQRNLQKEILIWGFFGTQFFWVPDPPPSPPSFLIHRGAAARMPARGGGLLSLGFTRQVQPLGGGDAQPPAAAPAGADGGVHSPRSGQGRSSKDPT